MQITVVGIADPLLIGNKNHETVKRKVTTAVVGIWLGAILLGRTNSVFHLLVRIDL